MAPALTHLPLSEQELHGLFVVLAGCVVGALLGRGITTGIPKWYLRALDRDAPADLAEWHAWYVFFPVRSVDGKWITIGEVWRRRADDQWQYRERSKTFDQWESEQW